MREITSNYIPYVLELSCAVYCNLIGAWKFLNRDKPDVHDSPHPLSLPGCVGGAGHETTIVKHIIQFNVAFHESRNVYTQSD